MADSIISQFQREYANPIETFRQVADITARDAINSSRRWQGMLVYVISTETTYELKGGITNSDWAVLGGGVTSIAQSGLETTFTLPDTSTITIDLSTCILQIDGYSVKKGTGVSISAIEVNDYCYGWEGDTFVAFKVDAIPYTTVGNRRFAVNNGII